MDRNLSGRWNFCTDENKVGIKEKWHLKSFSQTIHLPGTMEENGYGEVPAPSKKGLTHELEYSGWAWYQTRFSLSQWESAQCITFFMEKIPRDSFVWVDDKFYGTFNNLCTPHEYNLSGLTAGEHRLTVMIDNSNEVAGDELTSLKEEDDTIYNNVCIHLYTNFDSKIKNPSGGHGKYCFNGILGDIKLVFKPKFHILRANITPHLKNNSADITVNLINTDNVVGAASLDVFCDGDSIHKDIALTGEREQIETITLTFSKPIHAWDEFNPVCYTFYIQSTLNGVMDNQIIQCGLREITTDGHHIFINGNRLFIRATLEGDAYPLTGYEPLDKAFWTRAFTILKTYGLNGMRMHTFIPPRAAFEAAEELGFYLQIEIPGTSCPVKDEPEVVSEFLWSELKRALELYGNYACFMFMAMGNEQFIFDSDKEFLARHQKVIMEKVAYAQQADPRHLYSCTAHPYTDNRNDDFFVVATKGKHVLNGIRWGGPDPITTSRFNLEQPSTMVNFEQGILEIEKPSITHEVGQWAVYPNFAEMHKYTGVLKPKNYEMFASELEENGILHQNKDFVYNSGMLSTILYKEEIESALRTPDLSGFYLLDIHDYPGQGTSTVGLLDCFFDSKGLFTPEEFRQCCSPVVPLCSFERYTFVSGDEISLTPSVANYSNATVEGDMAISVTDESGKVVFSSRFNGTSPCGQLTVFEKQVFAPETDAAKKLTITFCVGDDSYKNAWNIWVYPKFLPQLDDGVHIVTSLDDATQQLLKQGERVLYVHPFGTHPENGVRGCFTTQFWNPFMKPQEALNGILCDPSHPLFKDFPTESYTNYQWWEIIMKSYPFYMDALPKEFFPIVQLVPGIKDNKKIGLIWECAVESGKLLVCTADLFNVTDRVAAKQLKYSILRYMNSNDFAPEATLSFELLQQVLR